MLLPPHPEIPFSPRRTPFFYGWVIVVATTTGVLFSLPGQTMGVAVFTDALLDATGLARVDLSHAYLIGTVTSALFLPWAGIQIDRLGVRVAAMAAAVGLGATVVFLSQVDRIAAVLHPSGRVSGFVLLAVGFAALRFTGQGVLTLASNTMLARWFDRRRGMAAAISGAFVAVGFAAAPLLLDAWIARSGWRGAWLQIGAVETIVMSLIAFVFFRENPESCGLTVDGPEVPRPRRPAPTPEAFATRSQALRTRGFWILSTTLALQALTVTGITLHVIDLGAAAGLAKTEALGLFPPIAVASIGSGVLIGWAIDRMRIRTLVWTMLACESIGFVASAHLGHPLGFPAAALGLGLAAGQFGVLSSVGFPRLFGRSHLGAISGANATIVVLGSAIGPSLLAASRSAFGSYEPVLYLLAALAPAIALAAWQPLHPRDVAPSRRDR